MEFNILVMPGDGVGPEVVAEGLKVLNSVAERFGHKFNYTFRDVGGIAIDKYGTPMPHENIALARSSHAVMFGSVGGPKWDLLPTTERPERGLLYLRRTLGLFANIRPVRVFPGMESASAVRPEQIKDVNLVMVRELTGGLYYAKPKRRWTMATGRRAVDTMKYSEREIARVLRVGFELARMRNRNLTSVDKANVLETSQLWREMATEMAQEYPDVKLEHALVDSCSMQLINDPRRFDVLVAENIFGDILSDEAGVLAGSLGMLPSASLAGVPTAGGKRRTLGLYEAVHGSAPDIAGEGKANPIATILSAGLMLRYSLLLTEESDLVEAAVGEALNRGLRTADIAAPDQRPVSTREMGDGIGVLVREM